MAARVAAQGLSRLAQDVGAAPLAQHPIHPGGLRVHQLLCRAAHPRSRWAASKRPIPSCWRRSEARHPALGTEDARGGPGGRDLRLGVLGTTYKAKLAEQGIIFCSFGEAVREHPELVRKYLGSVVPPSDNFFAALNAAVFSDGSFVYVPKGVRCPMELSTYFRINAAADGPVRAHADRRRRRRIRELSRGLHRAERDKNQLHAAVVELVALEGATIKYSTVQNWYPGDEEGKGGIYNFVTKRGKCAGNRSKIAWTQVETGSAITWKYPSVILQGDNTVGEFYSVAVVNGHQQADTGTKIESRGSQQPEHHRLQGHQRRPGTEQLPRPGEGAAEDRGRQELHPMRLDADRRPASGPTPSPTSTCKTSRSSTKNLRASTSKIGEDQIFYLKQRGLNCENAISMIVNGFCKEVFKELPMEFAVEAQKLLGISLEGSVGWGRARRFQSMSAAVLESRTCRRRPQTRRSSGASTSPVKPEEVRAVIWSQTIPGKTALARMPRRPSRPPQQTDQSVHLRRRGLLDLGARRAGPGGRVPGLPISGRDPGCLLNAYFLRAAYNEVRKAKGLEEMDSMDFIDLLEERPKVVELGAPR